MADAYNVSLTGPAGPLDAIWHPPAVASPPAFAAVVAHPHPLYGGTKDNAVVLAATDALLRAGGGALRFDFRGVGRSAGAHDGGRGELDDLGAAARLARELAGGAPLVVAGYSFGAIVTFRWLGAPADTGEPRPAAVLALAPPILHYDLGFLGDNTVPMVVACGGEDALTPRQELTRQAAAWGAVAAILWSDGAGHDLGVWAQPAALRAVLDEGVGRLLQRAAIANDRRSSPERRA